MATRDTVIASSYPALYHVTVMTTQRLVQETEPIRHPTVPLRSHRTGIVGWIRMYIHCSFIPTISSLGTCTSFQAWGRARHFKPGDVYVISSLGACMSFQAWGRARHDVNGSQ